MPWYASKSTSLNGAAANCPAPRQACSASWRAGRRALSHRRTGRRRLGGTCPHRPVSRHGVVGARGVSATASTGSAAQKEREHDLAQAHLRMGRKGTATATPPGQCRARFGERGFSMDRRPGLRSRRCGPATALGPCNERFARRDVGVRQELQMRVLYHLPLSPYARKVRLALAKKRLPFELRVEKVWERRPALPGTQPGRHEPPTWSGITAGDPDRRLSASIRPGLPGQQPDRTQPRRNQCEARRLEAWFDGKFAAEVTQNLYGKITAPAHETGNPDPAAICTADTASRYHLDCIECGAETRKWLAGSALSMADFAAAARSTSPARR